MAVQTTNVNLGDCSGVVYKETSISDDSGKFFLTNGQGCSTIWFLSLKAATKALKRDGIKTGRDFMDCSKCRNHYSINDSRWEIYPPHACGEYKEQYASEFNK